MICLKQCCGEFAVIAARDHAVHHPLFEIRSMVPTLRNVAMARRKPLASFGRELARRRWRASSPVPGTAVRRAFFPELFRVRPSVRARVRALERLTSSSSLAALQIGMHHVALDRAWAHDRDLDDEIVEFPRSKPRQHVHLRAALDLEHADGVGLAQHVVDRRILARHGREVIVFRPRAGRSDRTPCGCRSACRAPAHRLSSSPMRRGRPCPIR